MDPRLRESLYDLGRWLDATRAYHRDLVVVGGYAPVFYRHAPSAYAAGTPLLTTDADFAAPAQLAARDGRTVAEHVADEFTRFTVPAGIRPESETTRFVHQRHGTVQAPVYVEFVAPLEGRGVDRRGREVTDREVQPQLRAATVRFVELLRAEPLQMDARAVPGLGLDEPTPVAVAHPMAFILQKARIRDRRRLDKRAKDMAYIADVARITRPMWGELGEWLARRLVDPLVPQPWLADAASVIVDGFAEPGSFGCIETEQVYRAFPGDGLDADRTWRIVSRFIREVGLDALTPR